MSKGKSNSKSVLYADALDAAQSSSKWKDTVASSDTNNGLGWSELIRKYVKHNPNNQLQAATAVSEQTIQSILRDAAATLSRSSQDDNTESAIANSTAKALVLPFPPTLSNVDQRARVQEAVNQLQAAVKAHSSEKPEGILAALVVSALGLYALDKQQEALKQLQACPPAIGQPTGHLADLLVMSFALEGLIIERLDRPSEAIAAFSKASKAHAEFQKLHAGQFHEEMKIWTEIALYRRAILSLSHDQNNALEYHRAYQFSHLPNKKLIILRSHLQLVYDSANPSLAEIQKLQKEEGDILRRYTTFPKAGQTNSRMLDYIGRVFKGWRMMTASQARLETEVGQSETKRVIDIHTKALSYTFHSHLILRNLVQLYMAIADYERAVRVFETYVQLWEKAKETDLINVTRQMRHYKQIKDLKQADQESIQMPASAPGGEDEIDIDSLADYVEMCGVGVILYTRHIVNEEAALKAVKTADRAFELIDTDDTIAIPTRARAQRWRGMARAHLAWKEADPETQPETERLALQYLSEAVELDPTSFENLFQLACFQAERRDVQNATSAIRQALEIDSARIDAYHLLVLLISADKKSHAAALNAANIALGLTSRRTPAGLSELTQLVPQQRRLSRESATKLPNSDIHPHVVSANTNEQSTERHRRTSSGGDGSLPTEHQHIKSFPSQPESEHVQNGSMHQQHDFESDVSPTMSFDDLEREMELSITRNALLEAIDGPQIALQDQARLFATFAADFAQFKLPTVVVDGGQGTQEHDQTTLEPSKVQSPELLRTVTHDTLQAPKRVASMRSLVSQRTARSRVPNGHSAGQLANSEHPSSQSASSPASYASSIVQPATHVTDVPITAESSQEKDNLTAQQQRKRAIRIEQQLWLLSAATYRRSKDLEACRDAIQEAETLDEEEPEVWVQLGLLQIAANNTLLALQCFDKAIHFDLDYMPAIAHTARILLQEGGQSTSIAEGYLDNLTQTRGRDSSESWFLLSKVYEATDREERAIVCLEHALQLEETKPIRDVRTALRRYR